MNTIYHSDQGKNILLNSYEHSLSLLQTEPKRTCVQTRFGLTHVLEMGSSESKPLMILQGGNCINPMTLAWFQPLFEEYRIIAPDTIGHPGLSDETRISAQDDSFAYWIADLLRHFDLKKCAFIGPSYGGGIILRLAACMPERIACAVLVNPAGIKTGPKMPMIRKVLLPLLDFKLLSSSRALRRIADALSLGSMSEADMRILGEIFQYVRLERNMPKLVEKEELEDYSAPTLVLASKRDIFFPGEEVVRRAREVVPNLASTGIYNCGHFPTTEEKKKMNDDIRRFLYQFY
ncbi:alpha/beta fold hydrolase [Paenibacillus chitinolyticus]|uniref:alpha/beta fold hydrolase n=1 Tax=Paenibacillus chitinolyticus TaxID=79263 RepID=UPI003868E30A